MVPDGEEETEEEMRERVASRLASASSKDADDEKLFAEERERQEKRDAEVEASWSKRVLVAGKGPVAWQGARATVHIVGRQWFEDGDVFEDSRAREEPQILLLGRASVVPGLDSVAST